jgi:hypothetical protein
MDFNVMEDISFNNKNFLYDYHEVQELYFNTEHNYNVYLVGVTGLNKTNLLHRIVFDLIKSGISKQNIIYADFELQFIRQIPLDTILNFFPLQESKDLYLIINEIGLKEKFFDEIKMLRMKYPHIKLLASCSIPFLVYEYLHDIPDDYSKVVVLSPKNDSNIKCESDTFGFHKNIKYNIKNGVCEIKGLAKEGKVLSRQVIPQEIGGYPVKIIASGAFHHRSELTEIELPDTIEYIGDYAFTKCDNLNEIRLPKNLLYIGDCAFLGATNLKIIIGGDNVTHIGCSAFYATEWFTMQMNEFVILGKVLYFYKGDTEKIILPKSISVLGSYAFRNSDITEIDLAGIEKVEEGCFYGCKKLTETKNYPCRNVQAFTFYDCHSLRTFFNKIEFSAKHSFHNCTALENIIFHNAEIGTGAFENCERLISFSGNIKLVGKSAFYKTKIIRADLKNVKMIGDFAFLGSRLVNLLLQDVEKIGKYAFAQITELKEVYLKNCIKIKERIFQNSIAIIQAELPGNYPLNYYFGCKPQIKKLVVSGNCCDNFCRDNDILEEVLISYGYIGNWAFYKNANLTSVKLQNCDAIGAWAFAYCRQLQGVVIPESVNHIEMNAFRYCRKLSKIELHSTEPIIFGPNAFYSTADDKCFFVINKKRYLDISIWREYISNLVESMN